ncbi:type VI secretion protein [Streptomyces sp. MUM 203J]|nr:type VI secretion protein [Streptomyces sp. MUM 203J]
MVGVLAFLLGTTLLVWTSTGLGGLLTHGSWPSAVTFTRTPLAMRSLLSDPRALPAAWPATPPAELSGHGVFWGLLISQLLILAVLAFFALSAYARWRTPSPGPAAPKTTPAAIHPPTTATATLTATATATTPSGPSPPPVPSPRAHPGPTPAPPSPPTHPHLPHHHLLHGDRATLRPHALQAVLDAEGPALVVTSDPTLWSDTKDTRAKLGPVLLYDPGHLCDTPARLHWSPTDGCEDPSTAAARAAALLAPVRPRARIDAALADTAETLLRCWLHAAAVDGRPFKQVHRWAQHHGTAHEAVRILRTHPRATNSQAGLLESALTAYPERRDAARELTVRALTALSSVHIREACTPHRTDSLTLESFIEETGTLYMVGEPIEDPRTDPGAMPLLTALTSHVVEHGRRMAARSSDGRLDPPLTLVLDDIAAVAPLPHLPSLLATGHHEGLPTHALLRSREQARTHWPDTSLTTRSPSTSGGPTGSV